MGYRRGHCAYGPETKVKVSGFTPGPAVTAQCTNEMAQGVCRLASATIGVTINGW